jgi:hypothetical protein
MGAWGPDIFDDDLTSDMRKTFEDELELRSSVAHATTVVLREYSEALDDTDERPKVWLALATLQVDRGALQSHVRDHALAVIDSGEDQRRWDEGPATPEDAAKRKQVLAELRARLVAS